MSSNIKDQFNVLKIFLKYKFNSQPKIIQDRIKYFLIFGGIGVSGFTIYKLFFEKNEEKKENNNKIDIKFLKRLLYLIRITGKHSINLVPSIR
jgi:hypothetical protein